MHRSQQQERPPEPRRNGANPPSVSAETLEAIRQFDTCTVANAIEHFHVRLRNEGYTRPGLRVVTGGFPRLIGYAATSRIRSADPPMAGNSYVDRTDWWEPIGCLPLPRIAVIENLDRENAAGSTTGEVHAAILKAFGCGGLITNGAVRDVPALSRMDFAVFAPAVTVSHAYSHLVDFGRPVQVFGLEVRSGDLLYADCHGALSIPIEIAEELPAVAERIRAQEQRIVSVCQSPDFSPENLLKAIQNVR